MAGANDFTVDSAQGVEAINAITAALQKHGRAVDATADMIVKANAEFVKNQVVLKAVTDAGKAYTVSLKELTAAELAKTSVDKRIQANLVGITKDYKLQKIAIQETADAVSKAAAKQSAALEKVRAANAANRMEQMKQLSKSSGFSTVGNGQEILKSAQAAKQLRDYLKENATHWATLKSYFSKASAGSLKSFDIPDGKEQLARLVLNYVNAQKQIGNEARKAAAEQKKLLDEIALKQAQNQSRILSRQYSRGTGAFNPLGSGNQATFQNFAKTGAVAAPTGLAQATGLYKGLAAATLAAAQASAKHTQNMAILRGQMVKFGSEAEDAAARARAAWAIPLRFAALQVMRKVIYTLYSDTVNAFEAIKELQIRISEIRTLSQGQFQMPFATWSKGLRNLSDTYGATMEDVTKGTYELISNQVAQGSKSLDVMSEALRFQRVAVTSTANSVNLLSSALNSYNLNAEQATEINASFFRTIDLGRVTADEMANSYGQLSVIAGQMGAPIDELNAAVATLTIQGIKYDNASTQLRNVFLKLMKPSEEMKKVFQEWGFESGEAAIKTLGFAGVLGKLNDEVYSFSNTEGASTRVGELINRMRAIQGTLGLLGNNYGLYQNVLAQYTDKVKFYMNAGSISVESHGKTVEIELNKIRNYFVMTWGERILSGAASTFETLNKYFGGTTNALDQLIKILAAGAAAFVAFRVSSAAMGVGNLSLAWKQYVQNAKLGIASTNSVVVALNAKAAAYRSVGLAAKASAYEERAGRLAMSKAAKMSGGAALMGVAGAAVPTLALTAATYLISKAIMQYMSLEEEYGKLLTLDATLAQTNEKRLSQEIALVSQATEGYREKIKAMSQPVLNSITDEISTLNQAVAANEDIIENTLKTLKRQIETISSAFERRLNVVEGIITKIRENIDNSAKEMTALVTRPTDGYFDTVFNGIGNISDEWKRARASLMAYNRAVAEGKPTTTLRRNSSELPSLGKTQDSMIYAQKTQFLNQYMASVAQRATADYGQGDTASARKQFEELFRLADKLYDMGYTYNEVLSIRQRLAGTQQVFEAQYVAKQQQELALAQKLRDEETERLNTLKSIQEEYLNIKVSQANKKENLTKLDDLKKQLQTVLKGSNDKTVIDLSARINANMEIDSSLRDLSGEITGSVATNADKITTSLSILTKASDTHAKSLESILEAKQNIEVLKETRTILNDKRAYEQSLIENYKGKESSAITLGATAGKDASDLLSKTSMESIAKSVGSQHLAAYDINKAKEDVATTFNQLQTLLTQAAAGQLKSITPQRILGVQNKLRGFASTAQSPEVSNFVEQMNAQLGAIYKQITVYKAIQTDLQKVDTALSSFDRQLKRVTENLQQNVLNNPTIARLLEQGKSQGIGDKEFGNAKLELETIISKATAESVKQKMPSEYAGGLTIPNAYLAAKSADKPDTWETFLHKLPNDDISKTAKAAKNVGNTELQWVMEDELERRKKEGIYIEGTYKATEQVSKDLSQLAAAGLHAGSIYTHDIHTEALLRQMTPGALQANSATPQSSLVSKLNQADLINNASRTLFEQPQGQAKPYLSNRLRLLDTTPEQQRNSLGGIYSNLGRGTSLKSGLSDSQIARNKAALPKVDQQAYIYNRSFWMDSARRKIENNSGSKILGSDKSEVGPVNIYIAGKKVGTVLMPEIKRHKKNGLDLWGDNKL